MKRVGRMSSIAVDEQEDEYGDGSKGGGLLNVHEDGTKGENEALGDEDLEEEEDEGEDEGDGRGLEAIHLASDDDEEGGEDELYR
ncbi:hypothetical protein U1Q18_021729 [Sarracenia purpurea var. burkii]